MLGYLYNQLQCQTNLDPLIKDQVDVQFPTVHDGNHELDFYGRISNEKVLRKNLTWSVRIPEIYRVKTL